MQGETIRIIIALIGTLICAYFDIYNKRNVPNNFLFLFLAIAILINLVFFNNDLLHYVFFVTVVLAVIGYLSYILGYLGGADVFVILSLALLIPIPPSFVGMEINYPFILFVLIFSFVISALYMFIHSIIKLSNEKKVKPDKKYFLFIIPYSAVIYIVWNLPFFSPIFFVILSITLFLSIFFMAYRESLNRMIAQKIPLKKVEEEDILAIEFMDKDIVWKHRLQRLVTADELKRLKKLKLGEVWVYTNLPPFLPFLFIGLLSALLFSQYMLLVQG